MGDYGSHVHHAAAARGEPLDIAAHMAHLTLDIVTRALFGVDLGARAETVTRAFTTVNQHVGDNFYSPLGLLLPLPTAANLRAWAAMRTIDRVVREIIAECRRRSTDGDDLLPMLLGPRDEETNEGMSDRQLRDELITLLLAGYETTANVLGWTWYLLAQHPQVAATLRAELARVLAGHTPTAADLPDLACTRMVIAAPGGAACR